MPPMTKKRPHDTEPIYYVYVTTQWVEIRLGFYRDRDRSVTPANGDLPFKASPERILFATLGDARLRARDILFERKLRLTEQLRVNLRNIVELEKLKEAV